MDATTHAATRRLDSSLHAVGTSTTAIPVESAPALSVTADFRLSETGRKALYVNVAHTARFRDMSEEESRPLLQYLFAHSVKPEFTCRFRWQVGSLALWDNRCAMHNPVNDYHGHTRVMHRITLAGDVPR